MDKVQKPNVMFSLQIQRLLEREGQPSCWLSVSQPSQTCFIISQSADEHSYIHPPILPLKETCLEVARHPRAP